MSDNIWNILYAGLDINTFFIICHEKNFKVNAVAYIDKFQIFTWNPVNYLFKTIYFLRSLNKLRIIEFILNKAWFILMPFSSGVFLKYRKYLYALSVSKLNILDLENIEKIVAYIKLKNIDLIITSFWPLLPKEIILAPKHKTINIHPSILPKYRGSLPTLWSLKNNDKESAVTYMIIDPSMDTGNIIAQHSFPVLENDDWLSLENKIFKIIKNTFISDVKNYLLGTLKPISQNINIPASKTATYEGYRRINWATENAKDIFNKINLYPFLDHGIYCYTFWGNKKTWFKKNNFPQKINAKLHSTLKPGNFTLNFPTLLVKCKDDALRFRLFKDIDAASSIKLIFTHSGSFAQFMR